MAGGEREEEDLCLVVGFGTLGGLTRNSEAVFVFLWFSVLSRCHFFY